MFNIEKAHYILDEMVMNGHIIESNKSIILGITSFLILLAPLLALEKN
jgi:AP-4 complex subunit sigma-1